MGVVINGKYYKHKSARADRVSSTYKQWSHNEQRKTHAKEIIQPFKNGKPNEQFIEAYPEESKQRGFIKEN